MKTILFFMTTAFIFSCAPTHHSVLGQVGNGGGGDTPPDTVSQTAIVKITAKDWCQLLPNDANNYDTEWTFNIVKDKKIASYAKASDQSAMRWKNASWKFEGAKLTILPPNGTGTALFIKTVEFKTDETTEKETMKWTTIEPNSTIVPINFVECVVKTR